MYNSLQDVVIVDFRKVLLSCVYIIADLAEIVCCFYNRNKIFVG